MSETASPGRLAAWRARFDRWVEPRPDGLPAIRVLVALPLLLAVVGAILVGLSVNGSSSGAFYPELHEGRDPDLIAGAPQLIRTDEWNVQTVWAIAQAEQGLPVENETFPGGMDATIPQDLPRADWSVAFRPHLLGFLVWDVDHAIALKWWLPGLALVAAAYCFAVTILPRRPLLAAAISLGFFLSPFFQWWFLQTTLWPVVWGFVLLTTLVWCLRSATKVVPIVWAGILAYLTVVMAMGIYVPFIVPIVLVCALAAVGAVVDATRGGTRFGRLALRLSPVLVAGVLGSAVTVLWLSEKRETVEAFLGTAYPGERLFPTGRGDLVEVAATLSSSFALALKSGGWLGTNASEASTFFFVGIFLLPVVVWLLVRSRRTMAFPWMLVGASASTVVILAFIFIPGWDAVAHLLFLDRTMPNRLRIGLGFASLVITVILIRELSRDRRPGRVFAGVLAFAFLASQGAIAIALRVTAPGAIDPARYWWLLALVSAAAIYLLARSRAVLGVAAFLLVGVISSATVNPLYRGVLDLRETDASAAVQALDEQADGATWVGMGGRLPTALLLESGVEAFNGFQGAPSESMWGLVDPTGKYEFEWNRLAGVGWTPGTGEPQISNPAPDQIVATFDACSEFAQEHVDFVLVDESVDVESDCLVPVDEFDLAADGELRILEVIPARS
ncbi:hypothetical protein EV187_0334 [Agromyces ramosus]|uniref:4-amino-4-deoxy-L-arabinose transferase-like glycosyltransferase n=1 Tax=Agromyces ramosus TaxID=33879 RepID=A0A4Q7MMB2_9MICO|nr:hypothetical protein [Agromyces ramosus]RZS67912.1 hypothetical protein EV187_0334 [Agromyces ramosus]